MIRIVVIATQSLIQLLISEKFNSIQIITDVEEKVPVKYTLILVQLPQLIAFHYQVVQHAQIHVQVNVQIAYHYQVVQHTQIIDIILQILCSIRNDRRHLG